MTAAISAHRGGTEGAPEGTYEAYRAAPGTGAEYVEFDIRRTADAQLVAYHEPGTDGGQAIADISYARLCELAGYEVPLVSDVMRLIAGKAFGHLDLKEAGGEDVIIEQALEILGPGNFVATTLEDASVAAIKNRFPDVAVALSLGRDLGKMPWPMRLSARRQELFPLSRIRACGADWVAMHYRLARAGVLRQCHRAGIAAMIWTVNDDEAIARWLADPRVGVVVTDRPRHAVALRDRLRDTALCQPLLSSRSCAPWSAIVCSGFPPPPLSSWTTKVRCFSGVARIPEAGPCRAASSTRPSNQPMLLSASASRKPESSPSRRR